MDLSCHGIATQRVDVWVVRMNGPGIVRRRGGLRAGAPNARSRAGQTIAGRVAAFDKMHTEDLVRVVPGMRICGRELGEVNSRFGKLRVGSGLFCQYRNSWHSGRSPLPRGWG